MGEDAIDRISTNARAAWASFAIIVVAFGSAWYAYLDFVPPTTMRWWTAALILVLIAYVVVVSIFQFGPAELRARRRLWLGIGEAMHWSVWLLVQGVIWLLMPWGPTEMQMVTLLFSTGYIAANFVSSLDAPMLGRVRVFGMGVSLVAATVLHQISLWPYIAAYLLCFAIVMMMLSGVIDRGIAQLREARVEAVSARDARTRFIAAASHDLGQPLQAARLFFEQVVAARDAPRRRAAERNTRAALGAMERLIHQMLDHLRLGEGVVEARIEAFAAGALISRVVSQFEPVAELSGIAITAVPSTLEACGDPALVERALSNLIDNALRHSRAKRVIVGARKRGRLIRLYVIDDGRGIAAGEDERLFDAFVQGEEDGQPRTGLGIGLSSVKGLAALMHGAVGLDRHWTHGAAFFIELPALKGRHGA
jgi:signal transduction histidine kinase